MRFGIEIVDGAEPSAWTLRRGELGELELRAPTREDAVCVAIDFDRGDLARRLQTASKSQPLSRAIGLHRRSEPPRVLDATAGLGRDAMLLAHLGCSVVACERNGALALMLDEAAQRAPFAARLQVHHIDAEEYLAALAPGSIDVVYLDPMFPQQGRAQVKKEMQVCRRLAGMPASPAVLLHRAFLCARDRVVVKRHPHEQPLAGAPSFTVDGERVRFDVYLKSAAAPSAP
jgi:16S rRNA (guanine1516-N2)-methyltransferase